MLALTTLFLSLAGLALSAPAESSAPGNWKGFSGVGQLRTIWDEGDHSDLGCITETGLWTSNDKLCGTFYAVRYSEQAFKLFTSAGPCKIYGAQFVCGADNEPFLFGTWPWPNSPPNVESLRAGQYGRMASSGRNPPLSSDPPQEIHLVTLSEVGKYVWLTWSPLK